MIHIGTKLLVADNSGAKEVQCIKILGNSKKKYANITDKIVITVKKTVTPNKIKEGNVCNGIVIRTKVGIKRNNGFFFKFFDNSVILINKQEELIGTRIFGIVPREFKTTRYYKIISLASEIV